VTIAIVHQQRPFSGQWNTMNRPIANQIPHHWRSWLFDSGSLTQKLVQASRGHFKVQVISNRWGVPSHSEAQEIGLKPRQMAIIREVELHCYNQVWVCARSIIPYFTLRGPEKMLRNLGEKPLGALLFQHRNMSRGTLQVAGLQHSSNGQLSRHIYWARRSVFYLNQRILLVSEIFMPSMAMLTSQSIRQTT
jgi:chorismate lyase